MTWFRIDDGLDEHPKVEAMLEQDELRSLAAIGLWTLMGANSSRRLTDGRVTKRVIGHLAPVHGQALIAELREAGLVDPSSGGAIQIHDFLDHNPSKAEVLERRRADAERKARAREEKKRRDHEAQDEASPSGRPSGHDAMSERTSKRTRRNVRADVREESALPDPTRPDPITTGPPNPPRGGRRRDQESYQEQLDRWAEQLVKSHGVEPSRALTGEAISVAGRLRAAGADVTNEAVLERLRVRKPSWPRPEAQAT